MNLCGALEVKHVGSFLLFYLSVQHTHQQFVSVL